jgi:hypothetical protein
LVGRGISDPRQGSAWAGVRDPVEGETPPFAFPFAFGSRWTRGADRIDQWTAEGPVSLAAFLQALFGERPLWLRLLLAVRAGIVRLLTLSGPANDGSSRAHGGPRRNGVPMVPGERVWIFRVLAAEPGLVWVGESGSPDWRSVLAVAREPIGPGGRFHVVSAVWLRRRRARMYFRLAGAIRRPLVARLIRSAAAS